ncbi:hypothetical protein NMY22_g17022 [Coprinellus aureogranulatus]|nr:hypothetical protein NMY22_g17022 [Coprinellus aureogranulatus]
MHLLIAAVCLFSVAHVSGLAITSNAGNALSRRGPCDTYCDRFISVTQTCTTDSCFCTAENFNLMDSCFNCEIANIETSEAAVVIIMGGGGGTGVSMEEITEQANALKLDYIRTCAAQGYPITGVGSIDSTTSSSTTSSSMSSSSTSTTSSSTASSSYTYTTYSSSSTTSSYSTYTTTSSSSSTSRTTTSAASTASAPSFSSFSNQASKVALNVYCGIAVLLAVAFTHSL